MKRKKTIEKLIVIGLVLLINFFCYNCQHEPIMLSNRSYFKNMADTTTTAIHVTIPRIEYSVQKSSDEDILVYVSVTDQNGNVLKEFNQNNFDLKYLCKGDFDTIAIKEHVFSPDKSRRDRIAVVNTMDYSGSMNDNDVADMEQAVKTFIRMKHNDDYIQIIKFDDRVQIMNDFTNDTTILMNAVIQQFTRGWTAYYQSIYIGLQNVYDYTNLNRGLFPAVIAFTDGHDNSSNVGVSQVISRSLDMQVPLYTIGFGSVNTSLMTRMAEETGGRYFYTPTGSEIVNLYQTISGQLSNIYGLTIQKTTLACGEVTIIVEVVYENALGKHIASAARSFSIK